MENNKSLIQGGLGILLMFMFSKMLVVKPETVGFIDGIIFSWAFKASVGQEYNDFVQYLSIFFVAFILSFFVFEKNRNKIFYCIIVLTIMKWIFEIFYFSRILDDGFEIKLWAMFVFFIGCYLTYTGLLADKTLLIKEAENE